MIHRLSPSAIPHTLASAASRSEDNSQAARRPAASETAAAVDRFEPKTSSSGQLIAGNPALAASALMMNALVLLTPGNTTMTAGDPVSGSVGRSRQNTELVLPRRGLGGV
ncbi:MAG: hypothetical protein ACO3JL_00150 [Myxococcota bacterium]